MNLEGLVFGVGEILRNEINDWATTDGGTSHVYPDHPPLDLARSSYPRAAIDTISSDPRTNDVEKVLFSGDLLMEVTVYAVNSREIFSIVGDVHQAIIDYQDHSDYQFDNNGQALLDDWELNSDDMVGPLIEEDSDRGFTRYNKTIEFEWKYVTTKNTV